MNKKNFLSYILTITWFLTIILLLDGCKSTEILTPEPEVPVYEPDRVIMDMHNNQSEYDWFAARFTGDVYLGNQNHNISGTLRIKNNEAIYISLSPVLGIEIARALITPDTVKYLNRLESTYYIGDIAFLNSFMRTSIDFDLLQAILTGNDFSGNFSDSFTTSEEGNYILLHDPERPSGLKQSANQDIFINNQLWVDPSNYKIKKNVITEEQEKRSITAEYDEFEEHQGETIPTKLNLIVSDGGYNANLSMQYFRIDINEPQRMNFSVPSRYERIGSE